MPTLRKSIFMGILAMTAGGLAYQQACKSVNADASKTSGIVDNLVIKSQIRSFNDTQKKLIAAEKSGAAGCAKLDILWDKILDTKQDEDKILPPEGKGKEIIAFGNGSALRFWRAFQGWSQDEGGSDIRPYEELTTNSVRLTHRYAVLARMQFVVNKDVVQKLGYTGQYAEGNPCVLGRLSSAVPTSVNDRFTPSFAGKFFQDGNTETQTLIVQHDIGGQSSGTDFTVTPNREKVIDNNFYTHYLSNRLSFEKGVLSGVGAFSRFFYSAQWMAKNVLGLKYVIDPRELQANHLAAKGNDGQAIAAAKGPRFVWFAAPTDALRSQFNEMSREDLDFRKHFFSLNASRRKAGSLPIFNVYASDTWTYEPEKDATLIGQMMATSDFVASEAADVRLFFKHAAQFQKVPESEGLASPYTQDYAFSDWNDQLFTSNCRLGVTAAQIVPSTLNKLDGDFIQEAGLNPITRRHGDDGSVCLNNIVKDKLEETLAPLLRKL